MTPRTQGHHPCPLWAWEELGGFLEKSRPTKPWLVLLG